MSTRNTALLSSQISGLPRESEGGPRHVYTLGHEQLILHLDRVTAGGVELPTAVPDSGRVVCQLAAFWFAQTHNVAPSHFLTEDAAAISKRLSILGASGGLQTLAGRAHLVNRTRPLPVLCDVIGALLDTDWEEYRETGGHAGRALPGGLTEGESLHDPLFVARRLDEAPMAEHELSHQLDPGYARQIETHSRRLFAVATTIARESAGLLLSRARFTFGLLDATVVLVGRPLTPETASFREADTGATPSDRPDVARGPLDAYLRRIHWHGGDHLPELPPEVVQATADGYRALFERLTGLELV